MTDVHKTSYVTKTETVNFRHLGPGAQRTPYVLQFDGDEVMRVELDSTVVLVRPLTDVEMASLDDPDNWTWGPIAKALLRVVGMKKEPLNG